MKLLKLVSLLCLVATPGFAAAADLPAARDDLAVYAGKYPFDVIGGYSFLENPKVVEAVDLAAGPGTADWIADLDVGTPIALQEDGLIAALCEAHNCAGNNAAFAISLAGRLIAVCLFSKDGEVGVVPGQAHWIGLKLDRYLDPAEGGGGCPRDADEFLEAYARALH
jgi:hypothetical protein